MARINPDYIQRLYAGWLGKLIGVRHGAPIEGWSHEKIRETYGEISGYLVDYNAFAADDDTNGPMFLLRALTDYGMACTAREVGLTLLNYAPYEHGFFWWGGYGVSTEHTAYLNLRAGIDAPISGSAALNGKAQAEQIGGQIFIDTWGLIAPGAPETAAAYAKRAASVTHDGNGIYGGMFIAACIAAAFDERTPLAVIEAGLGVIPAESEYAVMMRDVVAWHRANPGDWLACFHWVQEKYGYHRYPGSCHIIPNAAVVALSLLYGAGDFGKTINICNMCGWDTDCNVGNVGAIVGVMAGLEGIGPEWRKPINDFYVSSSVMGSMNINDAPSDVALMARLAYAIAGEQPPPIWQEIFSHKGRLFHFELPGATHGFRAKADASPDSPLDALLTNTFETANQGTRCLKMEAKPAAGGVCLYHKTYYRPSDFYDSRYDPAFSPIVYPGQRLGATVMLAPSCAFPVRAAAYAWDENHAARHMGDETLLTPGAWQTLTCAIPAIHGGLISEIGVVFTPVEGGGEALVAYLDSFTVTGQADYSIDFSLEHMEIWRHRHTEVSQFTHLRGKWALEAGELCGSGVEHAEAYTGSHEWEDYTFEGTLRPVFGDTHLLNIRVQGAIRGYAAGLTAPDTLCLLKNSNGYRVLAQVPFPWRHGEEYRLWLKAEGNRISCGMGENTLLCYTDNDRPCLQGAIGASVPKGRCLYSNFVVRPAPQ